MSLSDDQLSYNEQNAPKISITPTATRSERSERSDNPAAVLRSLLSRLPAHPPSSTKSYALSAQDSTEQERDSDFDTVSESNDAPPSIAQESLKHIFSNALRDPGNTPQKVQRRKRDSIDSSEMEGNPRVEKERKGRQRSVSDDEVENASPSQSINRHDTRLKSTSPQPLTMEFLHERFSNSHNSRTTEYNHKEDSSSDTATILHNLNSSQAIPPAATSTPQQSQSLRLSTTSSFQFHSNLLDRDSEMRKAIEGMDDSYDESEDPSTHAFNSSKALHDSPVLRHHSPKSRFKPKPTFSSNYEYTPQSTPVDSPLDFTERNHPHWQPLTPITSFSKGSKLEPKTPVAPGSWEYTSQPIPFDSPLDIPERNSGFPTPIASSSKRSKLEPKTPVASGEWEDTIRPIPVDSPLDIPERNHPQPLTPVVKGSKLDPKTPAAPGAWEDTTQPTPVDSPLNIPERNSGLLTPIPSFSKGSKLDPKTPAAPGAWLANPVIKKSILKVRFETTVPSPPRKQKSPKSPKIRVLDAFGREQELASDLSNPESDNNSSPSAPRVVDAMGHEIDDEESHVEDTEVAATPSNSTVSRGELLSGIRNGLDELVVGINDLDKDDLSLSIDHDRVEELNTISSRARGLREKLYSLVNSNRLSSLRVSSTKTLWIQANPKVYLLLIILQLSLTWLVYRISINWAQELWLNRYYDPFNPELQAYLYISKSDMSIHDLRSESEGASRTTVWTSLAGRIWGGWIYFIGNMQFLFWPESAVLRYDNAWTPT